MLYYRAVAEFDAPAPESETTGMFVAYKDADCYAVARTLEPISILCLPPMTLVCRIWLTFGQCGVEAP